MSCFFHMNSFPSLISEKSVFPSILQALRPSQESGNLPGSVFEMEP